MKYKTHLAPKNKMKGAIVSIAMQKRESISVQILFHFRCLNKQSAFIFDHFVSDKKKCNGSSYLICMALTRQEHILKIFF